MMSATAPLGILAGSGGLPRQLIESCKQTGRTIALIAIEGETDRETVADAPHIWIRLGAVGQALDYLTSNGVKELVLAGKINRPSMSSILPDKKGAKLLSRLGLSLLGGDTKIFKTIVAFLEEEGFRVIGVEEVMQDLVAPKGTLGKHAPDEQALADIKLGADLVRAIGMFDIGQGVIVKNTLVLGIEAAEGTDALIERCSALRGNGKGGVLVKGRKPIQEERVDLPTIGIETISRVHAAGFAGVAVEAQHSLIVGKREVIETADKLGLFVFGY